MPWSGFSRSTIFISSPVRGMTCISPLAPTQLVAFGLNWDSWYICAVIRRQSSS